MAVLLLLRVPSGSCPVPGGCARCEPRPWRCRRELEELRLELGQERLRRRALQVRPQPGAAPARGSPAPPTTHGLSPQAEIERLREGLRG